MAVVAPSPTALPPWSVGQHHQSTFIVIMVIIIIIIIMVIYELYKSHTQTITTACTLEYSVEAKLMVCIVSITLSQLCDLRVGAHLRLHGPEPAVSCRHSSGMWLVGHTSPTYCHYLPSV